MEIKRVAVGSIHLDPANARSHGDVNMAAIVGSLKRFGQVEPLVVQKSSGRIIGGNGRVVAMKQLGWTECDVVEVDVDDLTATSLGIALNRSAALAEWNEPVLAKLLEELRAEDALDGVGFSSGDLDALLDQLQMGEESDIDLDQVPEPPAESVTQRGDQWVMGKLQHRLLCGDSASTEDLDRLLAGLPIHLVNTDPPYNVKVEPRSNNAIAAGGVGLPSPNQAAAFHHQAMDLSRHPEKAKPTHAKLRPRDRVLANDFMSDADFDVLLRRWFGNIGRVLVAGRAFYIWGGWSNWANYPPALAESGLYFAQGIIWDKQHPVLTRKDFMGATESCFYGWKQGAAHEYFGPNNVTDLWSVKKVSPQGMVHLCEKPVELAMRAILYSSRRSENVLDLFGGSGSTLIGCEQTERRGFLMELDPPYCDVILTRWRELFHDEPRLEASGRTFTEVAAERGVALGDATAATGSESGP